MCLSSDVDIHCNVQVIRFNNTVLIALCRQVEDLYSAMGHVVDVIKTELDQTPSDYVHRRNAIEKVLRTNKVSSLAIRINDLKRCISSLIDHTTKI